MDAGQSLVHIIIINILKSVFNKPALIQHAVVLEIPCSCKYYMLVAHNTHQ